MQRLSRLVLLAACVCALPTALQAATAEHDVVIRHGTLYDGSGGAGRRGEVAIDGDRIVYVGPHAPGHGKLEIDATGKAVAPGFINMLAHPEETLIADGRALSDMRRASRSRYSARTRWGR